MEFPHTEHRKDIAEATPTDSSVMKLAKNGGSSLRKVHFVTSENGRIVKERTASKGTVVNGRASLRQQTDSSCASKKSKTVVAKKREKIKQQRGSGNQNGVEEDVYEVEAILSHRKVGTNVVVGTSTTAVLWSNYLESVHVGHMDPTNAAV